MTLPTDGASPIRSKDTWSCSPCNGIPLALESSLDDTKFSHGGSIFLRSDGLVFCCDLSREMGQESQELTKQSTVQVLLGQISKNQVSISEGRSSADRIRESQALQSAMEKQTTDPAADTKTGFRKQRTYGPASSTATFDMREQGRKSTHDFSNAKVYLKSQNRPTRGKSFHISEKKIEQNRDRIPGLSFAF